jgi:hypothetical protein
MILRFAIAAAVLSFVCSSPVPAFAQGPAVPSLSVLGQLNSRAAEIAYQKKDWLAAQELFLNAIQVNPNDGRTAYFLGTALILDKEKDPYKLRSGTFYYARAAVLMREPSLVNWVKRQYVSMFRTPLGLDHYWDFVRTTPFAPEKVEDYPAAPPEPFDSQMAFQMLRDELLLPTGAKFFEDALSGNQTPRVKGRLIEHRPEIKPLELLISVDSGSGRGDVRVLLTKPLPGSAPAGTQLEFEGLVRSWQPNPFQMVLQSEPKEIKGWPLPIPVESSRQQQ